MGRQKILVISPICDQIDKLDKIKEFGDEYVTIFTGEICYPWDDIGKVQKRVDAIDNYLKAYSSFYVLGDGDLTFKTKNKFNSNNLNKWIDSQNLGINVMFRNHTSLTVVHGGIPLSAESWNDITSNMELAFVRNINNKPWHQNYNGKFGYVISAHPTSDEVKHYNFSSSIDVKGQVLAQEFDENGLQRTILL